MTAPKASAGSVTSEAIAGGAVISAALVLGSVYGGVFGTEAIVVRPITDLDKVPHNGDWTPSNTEAALCGPGEALLGGGFASMVTGAAGGALEQMPLINAEVRGMQGRITSDAVERPPRKWRRSA